MARRLLVLAACAAPAAPTRPVAHDDRIVARLGEREIADGFAQPRPLLDRAQYDAFNAKVKAHGQGLPELDVPADLSAARIAFGGGCRIAFVLLAGNDTDGYTLIVDSNDDGSFVGEPRYAMSNETGVWQALVPGTHMCRVRYDGAGITFEGTTVRRGSAWIDGVEVRVGLVTIDGASSVVAVDLDGDGTLDVHQERLRTTDDLVAIGGRSYTTSYLQDPPRIVLTPTPIDVAHVLAGLESPRVAPESKATDVRGHAVDVGARGGSWVVLAFWRGESPPAAGELLALEAHAKVIAFGSASRRTLDAFAAAVDFPVVDDQGREIANHFGLHETPSYVLIDLNGSVVCDGCSLAKIQRLAAHF